MRSSYIKNNYGELFTSIANIYKPKLVVELGTLDGFSLISFAKGAAEKVVGIDLFEDYDFKHGKQEEIFKQAELENVKVDLIKGDAFDAAHFFKSHSIDLLHIDVSNDGSKLWSLFDLWEDRVSKGGLIIFEGGSRERDDVEWMKKYKKTPIRTFINHLKDVKRYEVLTLTPYPSLTICRRVK